MKINKKKEIYSKPRIKVVEVLLEQNILQGSGIPGEDGEIDDQGDF